jgi:NADH-quinone oxidoreductase subunit M
MNGFIGEFLVLSGAFQAKMWWGIVGATGVIWSACYLLWMYQRVFFGQVKHDENNQLPDLNMREWTALLPAAVLALVMGVAPLWWLNGIGPAVSSVVSLNADKSVRSTRVPPPQAASTQPVPQLAKVVGQ